MNKIAQLTASTQTCDELVMLGITPRAFFWHFKEEELWDVWLTEDNQTYIKNEVVPAWTAQELQVLLGGDVPAPFIPRTIDISVDSVPIEGSHKKKAVYKYKYVWADTKIMRDWIKSPKLQNPGAQATAEILLMAIKKGFVLPAAANERYNQFFNV